MSGFKDDVLAILRDNVLLHGEALGWVVRESAKTPKNYEVLKYLQDNKYPVADRETKPVVLFDYIIIDYSNLNLHNLLKAFSLSSSGGIIIVEVTDYPYELSKYYRILGVKWANVVSYQDRKYLVVHSGVDYGN